MVYLTIKRTTGLTEEIACPDFPAANMPVLWPQIVAANRNAGRGECISYRVEAEALVSRKEINARLAAEKNAGRPYGGSEAEEGESYAGTERRDNSPYHKGDTDE